MAPGQRRGSPQPGCPEAGSGPLCLRRWCPAFQPGKVAPGAVCQALATGDCGDVLARWHSRLVYLLMFSSIDKSIIDDTLSWAWQSSVRAPITSIQ